MGKNREKISRKEEEEKSTRITSRAALWGIWSRSLFVSIVAQPPPPLLVEAHCAASQAAQAGRAETACRYKSLFAILDRPICFSVKSLQFEPILGWRKILVSCWNHSFSYSARAAQTALATLLCFAIYLRKSAELSLRSTALSFNIECDLKKVCYAAAESLECLKN